MEPERRAPTGTSRWQQLIGTLGLVVMLWVGNEMYDVLYGDIGGGGAGGGHGPDAPAENQDDESDTDDGGGHTPPAGGHG